jgi:hypothetical protein
MNKNIQIRVEKLEAEIDRQIRQAFLDYARSVEAILTDEEVLLYATYWDGFWTGDEPEHTFELMVVIEKIEADSQAISAFKKYMGLLDSAYPE